MAIERHEAQRPEHSWGNVRTLAVAVLVLMLLTVLAATMVDLWPMGTDYIETFRPVANRFLSGQTRLYDDTSPGYYNAPWSLVFWIPLSWLPLNVSQLIQIVSILVFIVISLHLLNGHRPIPAFALVFAVGNLHTLEELVQLNLDALVLLGLALGWWSIRHHRPWGLAAAFWILALKPSNVILAALVFLIAIKTWSLRDQLTTLSLTLFSALAAFPLIGWDWPLRYIRHYSSGPPPEELSISLWRINTQLSLPFWPAVVLSGFCFYVSLGAEVLMS